MTVALEQFPALLKTIFTTEVYEPLTRDVVKQLSSITWSPEGSNLRMLEENTVYSWDIFSMVVEVTAFKKHKDYITLYI